MANLGPLLILAGIGMVLNILKIHVLYVPFFLFAAAATFVAYRLSKVSYTRIEWDRGGIFVMKDANHDAIVDLIDAGRKRVLKRKYGLFDPSNSIEIELAKFKYLRDSGVFSELEYKALVDEAIKAHNIELPGEVGQIARI